MLARYKIYRGRRPPDEPLPSGIRQDTRKHTHHCLRPEAEMVQSFVANPSETTWEDFKHSYFAILEDRFAEDSSPFSELAELAQENPVVLGCNCPTAKNPNVLHCHTVLALRFMKEKFSDLEIQHPT